MNIYSTQTYSEISLEYTEGLIQWFLVGSLLQLHRSILDKKKLKSLPWTPFVMLSCNPRHFWPRILENVHYGILPSYASCSIFFWLQALAHTIQGVAFSSWIYILRFFSYHFVLLWLDLQIGLSSVFLNNEYF